MMNALDKICKEDIEIFNRTQAEGQKITACPYEHCRYAKLRQDLGLPVYSTEAFTKDEQNVSKD